MQFLMVDGTKNPNQPGAFQDAVQALYSLSYGAKFVLKKEGIEFKVSPLEGLWGSAGGLNPNQKTSWQWRQVCTWASRPGELGTTRACDPSPEFGSLSGVCETRAGCTSWSSRSC